MSDYGPEYQTVAIASVTITTIVPYTDEAEFREYEPEPENLHETLNLINDSSHAERVVDIDIERA